MKSGLTIALLLTTWLAGCSVEKFVRKNDDRYVKPEGDAELILYKGGVRVERDGKASPYRPRSALDFPLTGLYETYQYRFLDKYRITHQWLNSSNCEYSKLPTRTGRVGSSVETFAVYDIYEEGGVTKQRDAHPLKDFNRFVRSVKKQYPVYAPATPEESEASVREALERARRASRSGVYEAAPSGRRVPLRYEEKETGFQPVCIESWWTPSIHMTLRLYKRDLATWRAIRTERNPKGRWTERRVGNNVWLVEETAKEDLNPRPLNGVGGPFQFWFLPIGDTGYTLAFELGASKESLQFPETLARFQGTLRHLIESVRIEPLNAQLEAEQAELAKQARRAMREDCEAMAKRFGPSQGCKDLLAQPAD